MVEVIEAQKVEAPVSAVWAVLADFGGISRWASNVDHSCLTTGIADGAGATRRIQTGRSTVLETVTEWELGITATPQHPETELRAKGALFESQTKRRDPLANHWVVDGNLVTGQNQNAAPMVASELMQLLTSS